MNKIISTVDKSVLYITYWPTDICNYSCDYCFPGSTDGKYRYPNDVDAVIRGFKDLFTAYNSIGKSKFKLAIAGGGEPTLWPDLGIFCEQVKQLADVEIQITSNASRTLRWWDEHASVIDSVAFSCHYKEVDVDHFIAVSDLLYNYGVEVTAQVLMDPLNWDKCQTILNQLFTSKNNWFIQTKEVIGNGPYTSSQKEFLKNQYKRLIPSELLLKNIDFYQPIKSVQIVNDDVTLSHMNAYILENKNNFNGWSCNLSTERIAIDSSGDISGSCGVVIKQDLNIYNDNLLTMLSNLEPVVCVKNICDCPPDTHITKMAPL